MNAADSDLPIGLDITVAWGEQDLFGHVNNVVYFRWMESVRMHFLDRIGALRSHAEQGIGVILASTTCDFKRPVHWPAALHIRTGAVHVGTTSFTLAYRLTDADGTVLAEGTSVQVMYDYTKGRKVPIPGPIRTAIATLT
ncbi:MAG: acyl-CoA thioesterase [Flavobacteriales bacterium]|nr:acyl-CoA thioesterase [Flavobacteriales bacterium]